MCLESIASLRIATTVGKVAYRRNAVRAGQIQHHDSLRIERSTKLELAGTFWASFDCVDIG